MQSFFSHALNLLHFSDIPNPLSQELSIQNSCMVSLFTSPFTKVRDLFGIMSLLENPRPLYEALVPLLDVLKKASDATASAIHSEDKVPLILTRRGTTLTCDKAETISSDVDTGSQASKSACSCRYLGNSKVCQLDVVRGILSITDNLSGFIQGL